MTTFLNDERGVSTVWSIFWSVVFLIMAGLVIDTSYGYRTKTVLTATADASALAAMRGFRDEGSYGLYVHGDREYYISGGNTAPEGDNRADELAIGVSDTIVAPEGGISVTDTAMVTVGNWNEAARTYTPDTAPYNAARSQAVRTQDNGNPLGTLLLGALTPFRQWDVGATAIAYAYQLDCPAREGVMAGGTLNIASNNLWQGDLCLYGEDMVDLQNGNEFRVNADGEVPGIAFGETGCVSDGDTCVTSGFDNVVKGNNPGLTADMISGPHDWMPDVHRMIADIRSAILNPAKYAGADSALNQYIPDPLVTNPLRADGVAADLVYPEYPESLPAGATAAIRNGALYIAMSASDFQKAINDASGTGTMPLPRNAVYAVMDGCDKGNRRIELNSDIVLQDIVVYTGCRVLMDGNLTFENSMLYSTYDGNNPAVSGSSSVVIGGGTCDNPAGGSTIVTANSGINFAAKLQVEHSQLISGVDVDIAAKPNGMEGTNIMAARDVKITSNGAFQGCSYDSNAKKRVPYVYRLVQ